MNRPIKFRVWDHILSEWIKSDQLVLRPNGSITDGSILIDSKYIQFNTSLKDKNSKEIYEGDIVKWDGEFIAEVFFEQENAAFVIKSKKGGGAFMSENYVLNFQIIGNIFEHSELLK